VTLAISLIMMTTLLNNLIIFSRRRYYSEIKLRDKSIEVKMDVVGKVVHEEI
jgi:hypothetical protein